MNFETEKERRDYIIARADYFTVVRRTDMRMERYEQDTLEAARALAKNLPAHPSGKPWMIYAVAQGRDTWVENVG